MSNSFPEGRVAEAAVDLSQYRRGRVPRDVRLQQVLGLAEELFAEHGYTAASMDELARRAGVSKPMVYNLVGSKEELFRTCMDRTADELASRIREAVAGETELRSLLRSGARAWFEYIAEHRALWTAFLGGADAPMSAEVDHIRRRQARLVASLLAQKAPPTDPPAPATLLEPVAHLVNGAFEAVTRWWADNPDVTIAALAELCTDFLFPGLVAIATDPPAGWR
jgi:AcrR family transcriptional regulator